LVNNWVFFGDSESYKRGFISGKDLQRVLQVKTLVMLRC